MRISPRCSTLLIILLALGCDNASEPKNGGGAEKKFAESLKVTASSPITLKGGTRWPDGADTTVVYDLSEPLEVKNESGKTMTLSVFAQLGALVYDEFSGHSDYLEWGQGTLPMVRYDTTLRAGEKLTLYEGPLALGRRRPLDWRFPYAYRIKYWTDTDTAFIVDTFAGCTEENRYHGYFRSQDNALVDGPDDGDWESSDSTRLVVVRPYPNPVQMSAPTIRLDFTLSQPMDSLHMAVYETDKSVVWQLKEGQYSAGRWLATVTPTLQRPGLYRFVMKTFKGGQVTQVRGDVMFIQ
jgi:hypothetical protein